MTKIKLCGLTRLRDIETANLLLPEYVGFVFALKSRRYLAPERAETLRDRLDRRIRAVGVFVREEPSVIAGLLNNGVIDVAQLHGGENEDTIKTLRGLTDKPILQAFRVDGPADLERAQNSSADCVLLDNGAGGTGTSFDWALLKEFDRPYFLAGGLEPGNVAAAVKALRPYAVDVSSGIETGGVKDKNKMKAFVEAVRAASGEGERQ